MQNNETAQQFIFVLGTEFYVAGQDQIKNISLVVHLFKAINKGSTY